MSPSAKIPVPSFFADLDFSPTAPTGAKGATIQTRHSLPRPTRRSLLNHLLSTDSITPLNDLLTSALIRSTTTDPAGAADWPSRVHALALELLRSGACAPTVHELVNEITRRALEEPAASSSTTSKSTTTGKDDRARDRADGRVPTTTTTTTIVLPSGSYGPDGLPEVRMPRELVDRGIAFLEERIRDDIEVVEAEEEEEEEEGEEGV